MDPDERRLRRLLDFSSEPFSDRRRDDRPGASPAEPRPSARSFSSCAARTRALSMISRMFLRSPACACMTAVLPSWSLQSRSTLAVLQRYSTHLPWSFIAARISGDATPGRVASGLQSPATRRRR